MDNIISIKNLSYKYPNNKDETIKNISLNIKKGDWISIVGHNGSGKSTLARCIDGLLNFQKGSIEVNGLKVNEDNIWSIRSQIGMVFQNPDNQFVGATVEDDVAFGLENMNITTKVMHKIVDKVLKQVRMEKFKNRQPDQLSGGQKQRVAIAGVLAIKPDIIILDEATSMLDPIGRKEILNLIKTIHDESGITVISITHDVKEAMMSDNVLVLNNGKIEKFGLPREIFSDDNLIRKAGLSAPFSSTLYSILVNLQLNIPKKLKTNRQGLEKWIWEYLSKM